MAYHILIPDNLNQACIDLLDSVPDFRVSKGPLSREEALAAAKDAHAVIVRSSTKIDAEFLAAAPELQAVARAGVGVDNIDLQAAAERGVRVMNTPGGNTIAATEHTFGLMLAMARHIAPGHQSLIEGRWDRKKYMGTELRHKTIGMVGFGRIGRAMAVRAQAFEMNTIACDPLVPPEVFDEYHVTSVSLDVLFAKSHYITLHAPATEETRSMINAESIKQMRDGVRIINVARGTLIDAQALAEAIHVGKVAGAAVDVYASEPPAEGHPLIGLPGVIHTPHLGASTKEAQIAVAVMAGEQIRDALLEGEFRNVVNEKFLS